MLPNSLTGWACDSILLALFSWWLLRLYAQHRLIRRLTLSVQNVVTLIAPLVDYQCKLQTLREEASEDLAPSASADNYFDELLIQRHESMGPVWGHVKTIFVAGCSEAALDASELNRSTLEAVSGAAQRLRLELGLFVLIGLFGTMSGLAATLGLVSMNTPADQVVDSVTALLASMRNAFAPAIAGVFASVVGGFLYALFRQSTLDQFSIALRRATLSVWIPALYPTIGQKAAKWAMQTLRHAANVTEAAKTIEEDTYVLRESMRDAQAASVEFTRGIRALEKSALDSERILLHTRLGLAEEIKNFGQSLSRWSAFETEIRSFYESARLNQVHLAEQQKHLSGILEAHRELLLEGAGTLGSCSRGLQRALDAIPVTVRAGSAKMESTAELFQSTLGRLLVDTGTAISGAMKTLESANAESLLNSERRVATLLLQHTGVLDGIAQPIVHLERRLGGLGEPFRDAADNLIEIATNLVKISKGTAAQLGQAAIETRQLLEPVANAVHATLEQRSKFDQEILSHLNEIKALMPTSAIRDLGESVRSVIEQLKPAEKATTRALEDLTAVLRIEAKERSVNSRELSDRLGEI